MKARSLILTVAIMAAILFATVVSAQDKQVSAKKDTTRTEESLKILLDQMEIKGWVEKPQMVYVVPGTDPKVDDIVLERSFIDEILLPLDKDKFEKQEVLTKKHVIPW